MSEATLTRKRAAQLEKGDVAYLDGDRGAPSHIVEAQRVLMDVELLVHSGTPSKMERRTVDCDMTFSVGVLP